MHRKKYILSSLVMNFRFLGDISLPKKYFFEYFLWNSFFRSDFSDPLKSAIKFIMNILRWKIFFSHFIDGPDCRKTGFNPLDINFHCLHTFTTYLMIKVRNLCNLLHFNKKIFFNWEISHTKKTATGIKWDIAHFLKLTF